MAKKQKYIMTLDEGTTSCRTIVVDKKGNIVSMEQQEFTQSGVMKDMMTFVGPISMGLVVFSIGLSLGGTTGYAINPARDMVPRIVYRFTPYKNKTDANWSYSWIPVLAPITAGVIVWAFSRLA